MTYREAIDSAVRMHAKASQVREDLVICTHCFCLGEAYSLRTVCRVDGSGVEAVYRAKTRNWNGDDLPGQE